MSRFVYPFNFVPPADQLPQRKKQFKKLHRYAGKTGRIEFTLTNLSPLFIPDPEHTTYYFVKMENDKPQYHRVMDFFNVNGRLAIPGTSLKGMIRTAAEALSNSSFGVFTPEEERFTFRKVTDLGKGVNDLRRRMWGQWIEDGNNQPKIQPLKSTKIWREDFDKAYSLTTDDERGNRYDHLRKHKTEIDAKLWQLHTGSEHVREFDGHVVFDGTMTSEQDGELHRRKGTEKKGELGSKSEIRVKGRKDSIYGPPITPILKTLGIKKNDPGPWSVKFKTVLRVPAVLNEAQVATFEGDLSYQDLCLALNLNLADGDPVQYYPPGTKAYEGFNYFVDQRKKRNHQGQEEEPLQTPRALRDGRRQTG